MYLRWLFGKIAVLDKLLLLLELKIVLDEEKQLEVWD
eukprot:gene33934-43839_t